MPATPNQLRLCRGCWRTLTLQSLGRVGWGFSPALARASSTSPDRPCRAPLLQLHWRRSLPVAASCARPHPTTPTPRQTRQTADKTDSRQTADSRQDRQQTRPAADKTGSRQDRQQTRQAADKTCSRQDRQQTGQDATGQDATGQAADRTGCNRSPRTHSHTYIHIITCP
jgi:type IV secretory pathway VirB10-like protein